jgi:guanylate kinase
MRSPADPKKSSNSPEKPVDLRPYLGPPNPLLVVLSSPSGAGKDTVIKAMRELNCQFHLLVTATTRKPRPGEVNGVDYLFVSEQEFEDMIRKGHLLEHALVYDEHKGIPRDQVRSALAANRDVIMRIDVQGAAAVRRIAPDAILIFLLADSEEEFIARLLERGTETGEDLQRRIAEMHEEMKHIPEFDYVVVNRNGDPTQAARKIIAILTAEKCRTKQRTVAL